jgi:hypothetical protein
MDFMGGIRKLLAVRGDSPANLIEKTKYPRARVYSWFDQKRKSIPNVHDAIGIAYAYGVTVEEIADGDHGRDYVIDWAGRHGAKWKPPSRIAEIVSDLEYVNDDFLRIMAMTVKSAADLERSKGQLAAESKPQAYG